MFWHHHMRRGPGAASVWNPAQTTCPTSLCEYREVRIASGALELPILQLHLYANDVEALLGGHQAIGQLAEAMG